MTDRRTSPPHPNMGAGVTDRREADLEKLAQEWLDAQSDHCAECLADLLARVRRGERERIEGIVREVLNDPHTSEPYGTQPCHEILRRIKGEDR